MLRIVEATPGHAAWVAAFAREEDREEMWAANHATVGECIERGMASSTLCWVAEAENGEPLCIGGVSPVSVLTGIGCPWMVGTPAIERQAREFVRASRPVVAECARRYPRLLNFVDDRNVKAHTWLRWLGFTVWEPAPFGPDNLPFRRFQMGNF